MSHSLESKVKGLIEDAPREVQEVIAFVLELEEQNLHLKQPHLKDDIVRFIKRVVSK